MKRLIFVFLFSICFLVFGTLNSYAASPTPSPENQINELKDRIASRVAQLKLVERRGIIGKVTDVSDTQIKLTDVKGETRFVDVDELTKFSSRITPGGSVGISDIKKNDSLGILGLYNKQSRRILARSVQIISLSKMVHGYIAILNSENFVANIATDLNEQFEVSIETTTKNFSYDKDSEGLIRSGFSKLKEDEKIFVKGKEQTQGKISAGVLIVFPDILKIKNTTQIIPSPVTSTGSGKKLTPIIKY